MVTTRYVDVTTGNDGDDGETEGNAWQTLGFAANTVAADYKVFVKGSASYVVADPDTATTCWEITTAGGTTTPIIWEGYTTTPGDGGVVTVDADVNTLANACSVNVGANVYNTFKNFRFTGGSGDGFAGGTEDLITFKNCRFDNNDGIGVTGDNYIKLVGCLLDSNGSYGCDTDNFGIILGTIAHSNGNYGIFTSSSPVLLCLSYENTTGQIYAAGGSGNVVGMSTVDGNNVGNGILLPNTSVTSSVFNNIAFDNANGIISNSNNGSENNVALNNLFYSNTTDLTNFIASAGDVTGTSDPFTASGTNDYSLKSGSEAIDAGFDISQILTQWGL